MRTIVFGKKTWITINEQENDRRHNGEICNARPEFNKNKRHKNKDCQLETYICSY